MIKVENGDVSIVSGKVKNSFMVDCSDIFKRANLKFGFIYGAAGQNGKPVLFASSEISKDQLQQLRNVWNYSH